MRKVFRFSLIDSQTFRFHHQQEMEPDSTSNDNNSKDNDKIIKETATVPQNLRPSNSQQESHQSRPQKQSSARQRIQTQDIVAANAAYMESLKSAKQRKRELSTQSKSRKRTKRGIQDFAVMLQKLTDFRQVHGHCNVEIPSRGKKKEELTDLEQLGRWCGYIRTQYKLFRKHYDDPDNEKPSSLTIDNILQLTDLGFVFVMKPSEFRCSWEERLEQCKTFKAQHGHLRIPLEHPILGNFCSKLRDNYRNKKLGKPHTLTDEKERQLLELGFVFQVRQWFSKSPSVSWNDRFEELKQYQKQFGDTHVPFNHEGLGRWVKNQRRHYRYMINNDKRSTMTKERFHKLNSIGFAWKARGKQYASKSKQPASSEDENDSEEEEAPRLPPLPPPHLPHYPYFPPATRI